MKAAEWHQQGRSGDFLVKLKKEYTFLSFYVWISEFRMRGYFLEACFLNRSFKNLDKELYWTFLKIDTELLKAFDQRNWKYDLRICRYLIDPTLSPAK